MRYFPALFVMLILASLAAPARAALLNGADTGGVVPGEPMVGNLLGMLMTNAIPTVPLSEKLNSVKASAGYFSYKRDIGNDGSSGPNSGAFNEKQTGGGVAVTWLKGFGPHWGVTLTGAYGKTDGTLTKALPFKLTKDGPVKDDGFIGAAGGVYDPFSDPDGFRLPLTLALTYTHAAGRRGVIDFIFPAGNGALSGDHGQVVETYTANRPGVFIGAGPQGNWGPVRGAALIYGANSFGKARNHYTERDLTTHAETSSDSDSGVISAGGAVLSLTYRPLDLSFMYSLPISRGTSAGKLAAYFVGWTKSW